MRYIHLIPISEEEKEARRKYLIKVFKLFFIDGNKDEFVEFVSYPSNLNNCVLIYGHSKHINIFLKYYDIPEKKIILFTCNYNLKIPDRMKNKEIYISKTNNLFTNYYDGKQYGFEFDVTDSEILLYRYRNDSIYNQINNSFERLMIKSERNNR